MFLPFVFKFYSALRVPRYKLSRSQELVKEPYDLIRSLKFSLKASPMNYELIQAAEAN